MLAPFIGPPIELAGVPVESDAAVLYIIYKADLLAGELDQPDRRCITDPQIPGGVHGQDRVVQHAVIGDVGGAERVLHRVTVEGEIPA